MQRPNTSHTHTDARERARHHPMIKHTRDMEYTRRVSKTMHDISHTHFVAEQKKMCNKIKIKTLIGRAEINKFHIELQFSNDKKEIDIDY